MIPKCTRTQDCIGDIVAVPGEILASDGYCNHISAKCNKCEGLHWLVEFENEFLAYCENEYPDIEHNLSKEMKISDEMEKKLESAVEKFKSQFKSEVEDT